MKDKSQGRIEERYYYSVPVPEHCDWMTDEWIDCRSVGQSITYTLRDDKQTEDGRQT